MIRRPLRPIARVLKARESGVDPSMIEAEEKAARMHGQRNAERFRAQSRLVLLAFAFLLSFGAVGWKMTVLATTAPVEPITLGRSVQIVSQRANIVDRNGEILATNLATTSLFA
jgi:cell division protein FtsI (penicillin-binding protein 3)